MNKCQAIRIQSGNFGTNGSAAGRSQFAICIGEMQKMMLIGQSAGRYEDLIRIFNQHECINAWVG